MEVKMNLLDKANAQGGGLLQQLAINIQTNVNADQFAMKLLNIVGLVAGILLLAYIIYGGFLYLTAAGNEDNIKNGQKAIVNAIIGILILGLAYTLARFVIGAIGVGTGASSGTI
jgi:hypothetical protein